MQAIRIAHEPRVHQVCARLRCRPCELSFEIGIRRMISPTLKLDFNHCHQPNTAGMCLNTGPCPNQSTSAMFFARITDVKTTAAMRVIRQAIARFDEQKKETHAISAKAVM